MQLFQRPGKLRSHNECSSLYTYTNYKDLCREIAIEAKEMGYGVTLTSYDKLTGPRGLSQRRLKKAWTIATKGLKANGRIQRLYVDAVLHEQCRQIDQRLFSYAIG